MHPLVNGVGPNTPLLVKLTTGLAESGRIDSLDNLKDDKIYLFSGKNDRTVTTTVVDQTYAFFRAVGVPEASIDTTGVPMRATRSSPTTTQTASVR